MNRTTLSIDTQGYSMKKLNLIIITGCIILNLTGAASSNESALDLYQTALEQKDPHAIIQAYAQLPKKVRSQTAYHIPFIQTLLEYQPNADEAAQLTQIFSSAHHPVRKWITSGDRTLLERHLARQEIKQEIDYAAPSLQAVPPAETLVNRTLRTLSRKIFAAMPEKEIASLKTPQDLGSSIARYLIDNNIDLSIQTELFRYLARELATNQFLRLSDKTRTPQQLPRWLRAHLNLSLQDFIDYAIPFDIKTINGKLSLDLAGLYITDATGLENLLTGLREVNLHVLSLSGIPIGTLAPDTFNGLTSLQRLMLNNCHITAIAPHAFRGLSNLVDLELQNNGLTTIVSGTFDGLTHLSYLYLQNNRISTIAPGVFSNFAHAKVILLNGNPIMHNVAENIRITDEINEARWMYQRFYGSQHPATSNQ
jgi:hypothetical protein